MADSNSTAGQTSSQPAAAGSGATTSAAAPASQPSAAQATGTPPADKTAATAAAAATTTGTEGKPPADTKAATGEKPAAGDGKTAATDGKPPEGTAGEGEKKPDEKAAAAATGVPEKYEIKPPEGVELDAKFIDAMTPAFKAAGLDNAKVQQLADSFIKFQAGLAPAMLARDLEIVQKDDKLGGFNYGRTIDRVNSALGAFTTPEFRAKLERWGIANDLEFVRTFERIGTLMSPDERPGPSGRGARREDIPIADRIYGKGAQT